MSGYLGHVTDDTAAYIAKLKGINVGQVGGYLTGQNLDPFARAMAKDAAKVTRMIPGVGSRAAVNVGRFAGRAVPLLSAIGNITDVADIITGDESFGNKAMDAAAMTAGAAIGGVLGAGVFSPLTASIGAGIGKMASDGTQFLFGDKKSPEERRMEEALLALRGGVI
ncbi:MAG: hypothetical protein CMJ25_00020 [Phycisphaerae bacterium]|nr:hypothetical protein [Phycisphaerae bacterium]|tara:strand:+ start:7828 stop:8328 length:501 start_codon:yes stop_codon:yes gene_type:complete